MSLLSLTLLTVSAFAQPPTTTSYAPLRSPSPPPCPLPTTPPTLLNILMSAVIFRLTLGAYSIPIGVRNPPVNQLMIIDMGSDNMWFWCKTCNSYQMPGIFDAFNSTSISVVPCDSAACNQLQEHGCSKNQYVGTQTLTSFLEPTAWWALKEGHFHCLLNFGLSSLGIGGVQLPIPQNSFKGGTIIDLVTTYTRLLRLVYVAFRNPYLAKAINLPRALATTVFDICYNLSCLESVRVPNVSFFFSVGQILAL
ncbi:hypothetical protein FH972_012759 [Carpinus fangiana]|uniref:Peptidase A1 domain-containing protein n=1 Tax=Carpinus fangiana TaxID=176857 RepID=A0A5N6R5Q0_9ROSI|nr:hypothetical protein FH972_012759 [Carpinus fangiana]